MISPVELFLEPKHRTALNGLAQMLREKQLWAMATPPYPVSHGEVHIAAVMANVGKLLHAIGPERLIVRNEKSTHETLFALAAAVLVHDLAMGMVAAHTAVGPNTERRGHSSLKALKDYLAQFGVSAFLSEENLYHTTLIAWAHSGDEAFSAAQKADWVNVNFQNRAGSELIPLCMRLLRFADLCDVGPHRLNPVPEQTEWQARQLPHLEKHRLVKVAVAERWVEMQWARPEPFKKIEIDQAALLELTKLRHDIKRQLGQLTGWLVGWRLIDDLHLDDLAIQPAQSEAQQEHNQTTATTDAEEAPFTINAPPGPIPFVGREKDLSRLECLLGVGHAEPRHIIGIHGKGGVGKSTFLAHTAWTSSLRTVFPEGVLWTALGQNPLALNKTLGEWCRLSGLDATGKGRDEMVAELGNRLLGHKILLLVDDVWQSHDIGIFHRLCHPTVSLVFTTRIPDIAFRAVNEESIFELPLFDEESSMQLLRCLAPATVEKYEAACRELANDLEYLPLALQVAGRMIAKHLRQGFFDAERVFDELRDGAALLAESPPLSMLPFIEEANKNTTVAALISRSIDVLSKPARQCFCSLGVMAPKPATFDFQMISVTCFFLDDPLPALRELVDHGLVEAMSNQRFQMHAMLVAYAKSRLQEVENIDAL